MLRPLRPLLWVGSSGYRKFPQSADLRMLSTTMRSDSARRQAISRKAKVEVGSANIFADLGLPNAETHLLKAQIVSEIYRLANERGLTQAKAGKRMGISQPEVSRMFKGHFREYSIERL